MESAQQLLLKKLSNESSINEIQSYIKEIMKMRGFNKEKSSDKILLLVEEVGELAKAIRKIMKYLILIRIDLKLLLEAKEDNID